MLVESLSFKIINKRHTTEWDVGNSIEKFSHIPFSVTATNKHTLSLEQNLDVFSIVLTVESWLKPEQITIRSCSRRRDVQNLHEHKVLEKYKLSHPRSSSQAISAQALRACRGKIDGLSSAKAQRTGISAS